MIGHVLTASFAIGHHGRSLCGSVFDQKELKGREILSVFARNFKYKNDVRDVSVDGLLVLVVGIIC